MPPEPDLAYALGEWQRSMTAARKSAKTVRAYSHGVTGYLAWCKRTGTDPVLARDAVADYEISLHEAGQAAATVALRHRGLRRFAAWLVSDGQLPADPLAGMEPPKLSEPVVPKLSEDEIRRLLKACAGKAFIDRRDEFIVRFLLDAGCRAEELLSLKVTDVEPLSRMVATIERGKGGRGRLVPYQAATAVALDRYLRMRRAHRHAGAAALLLGARGGVLAYPGLYQALLRRAKLAALSDFHPHRLRHTMASAWLAAGGSEGGLMAVAGWKNRAMLDRYTRDTAAERAIEESRRLNLPDL
jgi:integrase